MIYLAKTCYKNLANALNSLTANADHTTGTTAGASGFDANTFYGNLDIRTLTVGTAYQLCFDKDGVGSTLDMWSGHWVTIGGFPTTSADGAKQLVINPASSLQRLYLECIGCHAQNPTAFLLRSSASNCDVYDRSGTMASTNNDLKSPSAAFYGQGLWFNLDLNTTHLAAGRDYAICVDFDGRFFIISPMVCYFLQQKVSPGSW